MDDDAFLGLGGVLFSSIGQSIGHLIAFSAFHRRPIFVASNCSSRLRDVGGPLQSGG